MESLRVMFVLIYTQVLYSTVESQYDPELIVEVDPSHSHLRSAPGYNTVTLTCTVTVSGTQNLQLDWKKNSQVITDNGDDVIIDSLTHCEDYIYEDYIYEEYKDNCESHLKLICREPGIFTYTCSVVWAYGTVTADALVSVGDPVPPLKPDGLSATSTQGFCREATINWDMDYVTYTPETYYVKYGTSSQELNNQSVTIYGSEDIHAIYESYTVQIVGLSTNTQYFYQVIANNSAGKTSSDTECFIECSTEICSTDLEFEDYADTTEFLAILLSTTIGIPALIFGICICIVIMCACCGCYAYCMEYCKKRRRNLNYVQMRNEVADDVIEEPLPEDIPVHIPDADPLDYEDQLRRHNARVIPRPPLPPP